MTSLGKSYFALPWIFRGSGRAGFSLVELLVIVGITGVLAALSVAGIAYALEAANQASCAAKLRKIGVALQQYANDHDQKILLYSYTPATEGKPASAIEWSEMLADYGLKMPDCHCPSLPVKNKKSTYTTLGRRGSADIDSSLILRGYAGTADGGANWLYLNRIPQHSRYVFWADSVFPLSNDSAARAGEQAYNFRLDGVKAGAEGVHLRHNGKANVGFLDGHVETLNPAGLRDIGIPSGYDSNVKPVTW